MIRKSALLAAFTTASFMLFAATPGDRADSAINSTTVAVAALAPVNAPPVQTCRNGSVSATGCRNEGMKVAAGNECPAASGEYCSDETPYCCGTPGNYYCAIDVNHC